MFTLTFISLNVIVRDLENLGMKRICILEDALRRSLACPLDENNDPATNEYFQLQEALDLLVEQLRELPGPPPS